jgi:protein tyrosine/serine phosphatase
MSLFAVLVVFILIIIKIVSPFIATSADANWIVDNIYLGNWKSSNDSHFLDDEDINTVLTFNTRRVNDRTMQLYEKLGILHVYFTIKDDLNANIIQHANTAINLIKESKSVMKGNVLVHCTAGISRSVSIVAAYLIKEKGMSAVNAINFIRTKRPIADPNPSFMRQLQTLER